MEIIAKCFVTLLEWLMTIFENSFGLKGSTTLDTFLAAFPVAAYCYQIFIIGGFFLLFTICVVQLFKSLFGPITEAEDPIKLVVRTCFFALLIAFSFQICSVMIDIGTVFNTAISDIEEEDIFTHETFSWEGLADRIFNADDFIDRVGTTAIFTALSFGNAVIMTIIAMMFYMIGREYLMFLIELVERYIILGLLTVISPLCIACGAARATNQIFRSWLQMYISQVVLLVFATFFLKTFNISFGLFLTGLANGTYTVYGTTREVDIIGPVFGLMLIAWLRQGQRIDQHMAALGLSVAQAGGFGNAFMQGMSRAVEAGNSVTNRVYGTNYGGKGAPKNAFQERMQLGARGIHDNRMKDAMDNSGGPKRTATGFIGNKMAQSAVKNGKTLSKAGTKSALQEQNGLKGPTLGESFKQKLKPKNAKGESAIPSDWKATDNCTMGNGKAHLEYKDSNGNLHSVDLSTNPEDFNNAKGVIEGKGGQQFAITGMGSNATANAVLGTTPGQTDTKNVTEASPDMKATDNGEMVTGSGKKVGEDELAHFDEQGNAIMPGEEGYEDAKSEDADSEQFAAEGFKEAEAQALEGMETDIKDENGNDIATVGEDGDVKMADNVLTDADGNTITDADGNAVGISADDMDNDGNINGNIVTDADGNAITDADGNAIVASADQFNEDGTLKDEAKESIANAAGITSESLDGAKKMDEDQQKALGVSHENAFQDLNGNVVGETEMDKQLAANAVDGNPGLQMADAETGNVISQDNLKQFDKDGNEVEAGTTGASYLNANGKFETKDGTEIQPMTTEAMKQNNQLSAKTMNDNTAGNAYTQSALNNARKAANINGKTAANQVSNTGGNLAKISSNSQGLTTQGEGNKVMLANAKTGALKMAADQNAPNESANLGAFNMGGKTSEKMMEDKNGTDIYDAKNNQFVDKNSSRGQELMKESSAPLKTFSSISKVAEGNSAQSKVAQSLMQNGSSASGIKLETGKDGKAITYDGSGKVVANGNGAFVKDAQTGTMINASSFIQNKNGSVAQFEHASAPSGTTMDIKTGSGAPAAKHNSSVVQTADGSMYAPQSFVSNSGNTATTVGDVASWRETQGMDGSAVELNRGTNGFETKTINGEAFHQATSSTNGSGAGDLYTASSFIQNEDTHQTQGYTAVQSYGNLVQDSATGQCYRPVNEIGGSVAPITSADGTMRVYDQAGGIMSITPSRNENGGIRTFNAAPEMAVTTLSKDDVRESYVPRNEASPLSCDTSGANYIKSNNSGDRGEIHSDGISASGQMKQFVKDSNSPGGYREAESSDFKSGAQLYAAVKDERDPEGSPNYMAISSNAQVETKSLRSNSGVSVSEMKDGSYRVDISASNLNVTRTDGNERFVGTFEGRKVVISDAALYHTQNNEQLNTNNSIRFTSPSNGRDYVMQFVEAAPASFKPNQMYTSPTQVANITKDFGLTGTKSAVGKSGYVPAINVVKTLSDGQNALMYSDKISSRKYNNAKKQYETPLFMTSPSKVPGLKPIGQGKGGYTYKVGTVVYDSRNNPNGKMNYDEKTINKIGDYRNLPIQHMERARNFDTTMRQAQSSDIRKANKRKVKKNK